MAAFLLQDGNDTFLKAASHVVHGNNDAGQAWHGDLPIVLV